MHIKFFKSILKELHFKNFKQNILIFLQIEQKIKDQKNFAAHLEGSCDTPVEKHWSTKVAAMC